MLKVAVYNQEGQKVKDTELNESVFGIEPNNQAIFDMVLLQRASWRQGTHKVKNRTEVKGGGKKPWRQKGTGRARQGSIRSPQWRGGGVVFAPKPRDYSYAVPKKVRRLAIKSVLTDKVNDNEMIVLDKLSLDAISTKKAVEVLKNIKADKKALVVVDKNDDTLYRSFRNIENVAICEARLINVYDCLKYNSLVITTDAVKILEEVFQ